MFYLVFQLFRPDTRNAHVDLHSSTSVQRGMNLREENKAIHMIDLINTSIKGDLKLCTEITYLYIVACTDLPTAAIR